MSTKSKQIEGGWQNTEVIWYNKDTIKYVGKSVIIQGRKRQNIGAASCELGLQIYIHTLALLYLGRYIPILYQSYLSIRPVIILIDFLLCLPQLPLAMVSVVIRLFAVQFLPLFSILLRILRKYRKTNLNGGPTLVLYDLTESRSLCSISSEFSNNNSEQQTGDSRGESTLYLKCNTMVILLDEVFITS